MFGAGDAAVSAAVARRIRAGRVGSGQGGRGVRQHRVAPVLHPGGAGVVGLAGEVEAPSAVRPDLARQPDRGVAVHQVALAFLVQQSGVFAIPKAASVEHVLDNALAGDLELTRAEMRAISDAFPVKARKSLPVI